MRKKTKRNKVSLSILKKLRAKAVFTRDHFKCVRCGRTDTLAPSHIYPQGRYPRMAWMLDNILTFCYGCHICWWHRNPLEASEWIQKNLPKERLERLKRISQTTPPPINRQEIKQALTHYLETHVP